MEFVAPRAALRKHPGNAPSLRSLQRRWFRAAYRQDPPRVRLTRMRTSQSLEVRPHIRSATPQRRPSAAARPRSSPSQGHAGVSIWQEATEVRPRPRARGRAVVPGGALSRGDAIPPKSEQGRDHQRVAHVGSEPVHEADGLGVEPDERGAASTPSYRPGSHFIPAKAATEAVVGSSVVRRIDP